MSAKNKRKFVSVQTKLKAIKRLDKGETIKKLAAEYGVGEVTVGDWRRNRLKIEQFCSQACSEDSAQRRKSMKKAEYEKTSQALYLWFCQQREKGSPISGPMLQEKAVFYQNTFKDGDEGFTASVGWLDRWKKRYGVRQLSVCGEKLSANAAAVEPFCRQVKEMMEKENLTLDQVYNCDETGLNFKMLPAKTLASKEEKSAPGHKKSKERLTILACSNATGNHKLKLVVVGKSAKPRAFKNVAMPALPAAYKNQKNAWMDRDIFKRWFFDSFVPDVKKFLEGKRLPVKAVLLLDNAPSHPNEEELHSGDIRALFLPPNVTSLIQPMDQGILQSLKKKYRRLLLQNLLLATEGEESVIGFLKTVTVKDVIYWVAESWNDITPETVAKCWHLLLQNYDKCTTKSDDEDEDNMPLVRLIRKLPGCENADTQEINEWLASDEQSEVTDENIIEMVNEEKTYHKEDDEEETSSQENGKISHGEGVASLEAALRYVEQQEEATPTDVLLLKRWRDIAAKKRCRSQRQRTIDSFFSRRQ